MSTRKATFDETDAGRLLAGLAPDLHGLTALAGGEASRAFAFTTDGQRMVPGVDHHFPYEL